jgi:hypothetical protein
MVASAPFIIPIFWVTSIQLKDEFPSYIRRRKANVCPTNGVVVYTTYRGLNSSPQMVMKG